MRNRAREKKQVGSVEQLVEFSDCDSRFGTINNILASRVLPEDDSINLESLIGIDAKHVLNLYAQMKRFGMCFLFPSLADCPNAVYQGFQEIAAKVEQEEHKTLKRHRKKSDDGNGKPRTQRKDKV